MKPIHIEIGGDRITQLLDEKESAIQHGITGNEVQRLIAALREAVEALDGVIADGFKSSGQYLIAERAERDIAAILEGKNGRS